MKKKSTRTFFRSFIRTLVSIASLIMIFFISFKVTTLYLEKTNKQDEENIVMEREGKLESVSLNLIFSLNESDKKLEHVVLETFNTKTDCLMYTTIPMNAKLAMSHELYEKMVDEYGDIPQILTFNSLKDYVKPANYYDFGAELLEDELNQQISYYTIVPSDIFNDIFTKDEDHLVLSDSVKKKTAHYDEQAIITYLTEFYNNTKCNLSLKQRLTYTPALSKVVWEDVIFNVIPGEGDSVGYEIDTEKTDALWKAMKENYVAEEVKALAGAAEKISLDKNISIYNGSGINGLAGSIQKKLEAEGYTVKGIANYTSSDVQETIIQVREDGMGSDLLGSFHKASIQVKEDLPYGTDIQIILGKSESLS